MATVANYNSTSPDLRAITNDILQRGPTIADIYAAMADDDDTQITIPEAAVGTRRLCPLVQVLRHTGGDITSAAAATRAMTDGDTAEIKVDIFGTGQWVTFTHTFSGLTAANATPAQIAASINADTQEIAPSLGVVGSQGYALNELVVAVASLTANAVTLFPVKPRSKVIVGAQPSVLGFAGTADYSKRIYVSQATPVLLTGTGWSFSYNADTRVLTVKNETGGAVNRVQVIAHFP